MNKDAVFTEEVLGHFEFSLSKLNPYYNIPEGITGFTEKTEYTTTTTDAKKIQSFLAFTSDSITGIMIAEKDYTEYASNAVGSTILATASSASLNLNVNKAAERTFKVFDGAEVKIGIKI